jgi:DNA helicase-2/ATP-dependent DNA helicase PcrA
VVGDDDQSLFRFRRAEVRNILEFPERFPGTDIIRLERNYRSTAPILKIAASVVDHNEGRLGKTLKAERGKGKKPVLAFLPDQDEEAVFCAHLIETSVKSGNGSNDAGTRKQAKGAYSDWAVLYRTNAQSLGFETEFLRRRIPYRVVGSLKFYEREEVKDALALLSFLVNPKDEVAFRRVVNKPARGVGAVTVGRIVEEAMGEVEGNLKLAAYRLLTILPAKSRAGLEAFFKAIEEARSILIPAEAKPLEETPNASRKTRKKKKKAAEQETQGDKDSTQREGLQGGEGLSVCVVKLVLNTGIAEYHLNHDEIAGNQRSNNLQELINAASLYPATESGLLEFLEHIELDRSMEAMEEKDGITVQDAVTLITLHNTKGLEFKRVIMTGIEQGIFPRDEKKGEELEEERRLFYVGATRAMDELYLTACKLRRMYGYTAPMEPSLFLKELDKTNLRIIGTMPYSFTVSPEPVQPVLDPGTEKTWQVGNRLFHDDQGYGSVIGIRETEEGPVIQVHFDTGKEMHFLGLHQSSRITKIRNE